MSLSIFDYSERAIAVFGETKNYKNKLTEIGGKYNASLNDDGEKKAGWIFPKSKKNIVQQLENIHTFYKQIQHFTQLYTIIHNYKK